MLFFLNYWCVEIISEAHGVWEESASFTHLMGGGGG